MNAICGTDPRPAGAPRRGCAGLPRLKPWAIAFGRCAAERPVAAAIKDVGANVGVNVGVSEQILDVLARQPHLSARELAALLHKTTRTVERHLKALREQGRLRRVGSDKAGHWEVIEGPS